MNHTEIINTLRNFRSVNKYDVFRELIPAVSDTAEDKKSIVETLLDECCDKLLLSFQTSKKPTKTQLKQIIFITLDAIKDADINEVNRDFGYELCWYLSEKAGLRIKTSSAGKVWGYWETEDDVVKTIKQSKKSYKKGTRS